MSELRVARLNQIVCQEFNNIIRTLYRDVLQDVTITAVQISPDMHDARVYVSILGGAREEKYAFDLLKKYLGAIKKHVFMKIKTKYVPRMVLKIDYSIRRGQEVLNILDALGRTE